MSDKAYSGMSKRSDKHFMAIFEEFLQKTVERIYSYFFFFSLKCQTYEPTSSRRVS